MLKDFGNTATKLMKNPLGILALLIVLVYGIAGFVASSSVFQPQERITLIYFMVSFPFVVLIILYLLVTRHHNKLYAPSDYVNEENFVKSIEAKISEINLEVSNVKKNIDLSLSYEIKKYITEADNKIGAGCLRDDEKASEILLNIGRKMLLNSRYDQALQIFEEAINHCPTVRSWTLKGLALKRLGDIEPAIRACTKAIEIESDDEEAKANAYWNRACYNSLLKCSIETIITDLERSLEIRKSYHKDLVTDPDLEFARTNQKFINFFNL